MADAILETFGKAVKTARLARSWTLENLAHEALGNSTRKGYCSQVEMGKRNLSESTIRGFARALDLRDAATAPLLNRALPADDQSEAEDATTERLLGEVETLRDKLKLSEALAVALAYKYAEGNPTDIEGALKGLEAAFETAAEQKARDALPSNIDDAVDKVLTEVARLNEEGAIDEADDLLKREFQGLSSEIERKRAALDRICDRRVAQAMMSGNASELSIRILERIRLGQPSYQEQYSLLGREIHKFYSRGLQLGTSFDLQTAAELNIRQIEVARTKVEKACAHNDLGLSLMILGSRINGGNGAQLLSRAFEAFEEALMLFSFEDEELWWAAVQNNLGLILQEQGLRSEGEHQAKFLSRSKSAFKEALKIRTRKQAPSDWAMTQSNLANTLQYQGDRVEGRAGTELLEDAVKSYDAALEVFSRKSHPTEWAITNCNKAGALRSQGLRTTGAEALALFEQAIDSHDAALEVYTKDQYPLDWARTLINKGNALSDKGVHTRGDHSERTLAAAIHAYDASLTVFNHEEHPLIWAFIQSNRGAVLSDRGASTSGDDGAKFFSEAIAAYKAALETCTREHHPIDWATTQENISRTKSQWSEHVNAKNPSTLLIEALEHVDAALAVFDPKHTPYNHSKATRLRDDIHAKLNLLP